MQIELKGQVLFKTKNYNEAIAALNISIELYPNLKEAYFFKGNNFKFLIRIFKKNFAIVR